MATLFWPARAISEVQTKVREVSESVIAIEVGLSTGLLMVHPRNWSWRSNSSRSAGTLDALMDERFITVTEATLGLARSVIRAAN
jgi:hypothetical protein